MIMALTARCWGGLSNARRRRSFCFGSRGASVAGVCQESAGRSRTVDSTISEGRRKAAVELVAAPTTSPARWKLVRDIRLVLQLYPHNAPAHLRRAITLVNSTPHPMPAGRCSGLFGGPGKRLLRVSRLPPTLP